jgi:hypothetical protein
MRRLANHPHLSGRSCAAASLFSIRSRPLHLCSNIFLLRTRNFRSLCIGRGAAERDGAAAAGVGPYASDRPALHGLGADVHLPAPRRVHERQRRAALKPHKKRLLWTSRQLFKNHWDILFGYFLFCHSREHILNIFTHSQRAFFFFTLSYLDCFARAQRRK